jgi:Dyp-type peroxidase family
MPDWAANGAFLVNRRLRQDVSGFWSWCEAEAQKEANASQKEASAPLTAEAIAARLFGLWPSGCPLARSPLTDIAELGDDKLANNAYAFAVPSLVKTAPGDAFPKAVAVDVDGIVCPLSAHTRKMNPRDGPNDVSTPLKRRLMRRGLPYGPQLVNPKSGIDDGKDRGLMFIAYCSSIEEQFEFLQRKWANSEHSPTDPTDIDPIIGQVWPPDDL